MVMIKFVHDENHLYHKYHKESKFNKDAYNPGTKAWRERQLEERQRMHPLPYDPAYITTNEDWLKNRILNLKKKHPEIDITANSREEYDDEQDIMWFSCSIPKSYINVCNPELQTDLDKKGA